MRLWIGVAAVGLALGAGQAGVRAQSPAAVAEPDASVGAALRSLASRAAVVFAGQVIAIERHGGVVEIVFRVDMPVLGQPGATYTLREWAGLWPPGQWRYTVGERAMVFLHGSSQAGLSSAVDGGEGVVPVVVSGAEGTPLLDVRRLSTRVLRQVGQPLPDGDIGGMTLADAVTLVATWRTTPVREPSRHPLPPNVPLLPRRAAGSAKLPETRIQLSPAQTGPVQFVVQRSDDAQ